MTKDENGATGVGSTDVCVSREYIIRYLSVDQRSISLNDAEREQFIAVSVLYQLDPFKREIHYGYSEFLGKRRFQLIVGYEVYIKKAERTGLLDGWKAWIEGSGDDMKAVVEINRKDWAHPFIHEVYWNEAVQMKDDGSISDFWSKMPRFQLKKVAISQGFRMSFSHEIGGIPYDGVELPLVGSDHSDIDLPKDKAQKTRTETTTLLNGSKLIKQIHELLMSNQKVLSDQHMEWVENQLRLEKTEAQLRGLLKHVTQVIEAGGDKEDPICKRGKRSGTTRKSYPARVPRITSVVTPANVAGLPIF